MKKDELGHLIKSRYGTFQRFCDATGVEPRSLFGYRKGAMPQDMLRTQAIARALGLSAEELTKKIQAANG